MEGGAVGHSFERDPPRGHPCQVWLIWFSGFREEDLNVIFYQNMPNLHNRYKGWPLGGSLSKLCPTAPPSIQDGRHY
jgi:hypothetical protein